MPAAIGYARISTEDQSQNSIPGQVADITSYCQRNGLELLKVFTDDGQSAFNFDRKEWKQVEQFIRANREVKYLVVYAIDRFSRANLSEALQKMDEVQRRLSVKILTVTDPVDLNIDDFGTDLRRIVELLFANYELKKIRKRTSDGLYHANAAGRWVNKAPYGYLNKRDPDGKPILVIDEEKAYIIRLIFRQFLAGSQLDEIRRHAAANGMKLKGSSAIRRVLENPLYAGLIQLPKHGQNPARVVKAIHDPIIAENDYWMTQDKLTDRGRATQRREDVFLKGALRCHCGLLLSSDKARGKSGKYYLYYLCRNHRKNLSAVKLHKQMSEILETLSLSPQSVQEIKDKLTGLIDTRLNSKGGDLMRAKLNLQKTRDKISVTQEKYLLQPDIDSKVYSKVTAGLKADEARLQQQITELNSTSGDYYSVLNSLLPKLASTAEVFDTLLLVRKTAFIQAVFGTSLWYEDGMFRTPWLHPLFADKQLELKEKGLLIIQQPTSFSGDTPGRRVNGSLFEHLTDLLRVVA